MPCLKLSNNKLLPPNQRASDVAAKAVEGIADIQQQKTDAAFRVQGIQCVVYHRLNQGRKCSCQAHSQKLKSRLNENGEADRGFINNLLVGSEFGVVDYTPSPSVSSQGLSFEGPSSSEIPMLWNQVSNATQLEEEEVGDNGVVTKEQLEDQYDGFDPYALSFGDSACPLCFGTGFVNGFSVYNGLRTVVPCDDMNIGALGILHVDKYPFVAESSFFEFSLTLPRGFVGLDAFRLMNGWDVVRCQLFLDDEPATYKRILECADGKIHKVTGKFNEVQKFTHFEFQVNLSVKSSYIEFPKMQSEPRMDLLDPTSDFQLLLSPDIPHIGQRDIICDCLYGHALLVQDQSWLNTRMRQMISGWEVNVRVVQPQEVYFNLPRRKLTRTKDQTVNPVIGNIGNRP